MPKLPSFFDTASSKEPKSSDDTGKKRTVPHTNDSWATYVYFQGLNFWFFLPTNKKYFTELIFSSGFYGRKGKVVKLLYQLRAYPRTAYKPK